MHYRSIASLSEDFRRRIVSPVEVTEHMIARIDTTDAALRSYVTVTAERARARARIAETEIARGQWRGPLHGVPIGLKDIIYTDFAPTSGGTSIYRDFLPAFSATVVKRLEGAGAIVLGKLKTTEQAFATHHPSVEPPINPWGSELWAGCSSSGSGVATAAGLAFGTLGSDTGGSIRYPAAVNGITGLKPTYGRVSRHGVFPLADTLDHIGPMTRSAVDAAIMLSAIAGQDPNDPSALCEHVPNYADACTSGINGLRIGLPIPYATDGVDSQVVAAWEAAGRVLADLGATVRNASFPAWRDATSRWETLCSAETALAHRKTHPSRKNEYGPVLSGFIEGGQAIRGIDLAEANILRQTLCAEMATAFRDVDLFLIPTMVYCTPTRKQWDASTGSDLTEIVRFTAPANLTGLPTITFPAGFDSCGAPLSAQLLGPRLSEELLCRVAGAFQRATDWHLRFPAV